MLSQGAGFWQLVAGVVLLVYGLLIKFLIPDPFGTVPADGFVSYAPILLGLVITALGLLRCFGK
jgi:hypothetical protein